jgi:hypothetical protein
MKIIPVHKNLYSNNIYFSSAGCNTGNRNYVPNEACFRDIGDIFSMYFNDEKRHVVSGKCLEDEYSLNTTVMPAKNSSYIQGTIGADNVLINIKKKKNFWGNTITKIEGSVGDNKLSLVSKVKGSNQYIRGKFNKEDVNVVFWNSNQYDSSCITGENINMRIANDTYTVLGGSRLNSKLLPILVCLSNIKYTM